MDQILHALQNALSNQFLSGGLVLGIVGSAIALCRQLPGKIIAWLKRRLIVTVDVTNDDPVFEWLSLWLAEHPYSKRARCLTARSRRDDSGRIATDNGDKVVSVDFTPAPGNHVFLYRRRLVWLSRERKDLNADKSEQVFNRQHRETFQINVLGRKQDVIRSLVDDARRVAIETQNSRVEIFVSAHGYWNRSDLRQMRPLSTIILPDNQAEEVADLIREFLDREDWYRERGIPYQLSFLFHGVPGSGKTSLIAALAGEFKKPLYQLSLGDPHLTDGNLSQLLGNARDGGIILLEDIDAIFNKREKAKDIDNGVTFSGLLNALNGVASKEGSLIFMTTNHKEVLDPALIRPGRADVHIEFDYATKEQAASLFRQFFPESNPVLASRFAETIGRHSTMAQVQGHLLMHKDSPERAAEFMRLEIVA